LQGGAEALPDYEILEILLAASKPAWRHQAAGKTADRPFRRFRCGAERRSGGIAGGGAPRAVPLGNAGIAMLKAVARGGAAAVAIAAAPGRRDRLLGQADRLLARRTSPMARSRNFICCFSRPQERADPARAAAAAAPSTTTPVYPARGRQARVGTQRVGADPGAQPPVRRPDLRPRADIAVTPRHRQRSEAAGGDRTRPRHHWPRPPHTSLRDPGVVNMMASRRRPGTTVLGSSSRFDHGNRLGRRLLSEPAGP